LELSDEDFSRLRIDAGKMSAKMRAVRIVAASSVSKADLQQRLIQKGEDPAYAELAVSWMEDMDLLDDEKTAHQIVSKCIDKGYGRARAKQALYEKRIPRDLWDVALEDYPDQTEKILAYLRAKLTDTQDEKAVRRVTDALMRRGHDYGQIKSAIRQLNMQLQEDF
jgi:SOS response regulatory protein OraA/RecX